MKKRTLFILAALCLINGAHASHDITLDSGETKTLKSIFFGEKNPKMGMISEMPPLQRSLVIGFGLDVKITDEKSLLEVIRGHLEKKERVKIKISVTKEESGYFIENLSLWDQRFITPIPQQLWNLIHLKKLFISSCLPTKKLPHGVHKLENLQSLILCQCGLEYLTDDIGQMKALTHLDLSLNKLKCFPQEVLGLTQLQRLKIMNNDLQGTLPQGVSVLQNLKELDLSSNRLSGAIPQDLFAITSLERLNLGQNGFQGPLSDHINHLTNLEELHLCGNKIRDFLPDLTELTHLQRLDLSNNQFFGGIPGTWKRLKALMEINVAHNLLEGPIPSWIFSVSKCLLGFNGFRADTVTIPGKVPHGPVDISLSGNTLLTGALNIHSSTVGTIDIQGTPFWRLHTFGDDGLMHSFEPLEIKAKGNTFAPGNIDLPRQAILCEAILKTTSPRRYNTCL